MIHGILLVAGSVLLFLAVVLSMAWQWCDGKGDKVMEAAMELRRKLNAGEFHHTDLGWKRLEQDEQRCIRLRQWGNRIRPVGVFCLYAGIIACSLGVLVWGFDSIDASLERRLLRCQ